MLRSLTVKLLPATLLASMMLTAPITVHAEPAAQSAEKQAMQLSSDQQKLMGQLQQAQAAYQQTAMQVQQLEQKVIVQSKPLQAKQKKLEDLVEKKVNTDGFDVKKEMAELKAIMQKYQSGKEKPTQEVIADFQKRQAVVQQKQATAMQDKDVQKMIKEFNDDMMAEAKKVDPNTEALLARLKSQVEEIQSLRQKIQASFKK